LNSDSISVLSVVIRATCIISRARVSQAMSARTAYTYPTSRRRDVEGAAEERAGRLKEEDVKEVAEERAGRGGRGGGGGGESRKRRV
jgi:hypothetical protein